MNRKIAWISRAQMISMLLVVLHHSLPRGYGGPEWLYAVIETVHYPALACFFALSGMLADGWRKYGYGGYLRRRFVRLMTPFFCVNLLMLAPRYLAALALGYRAQLTPQWLILSFLYPHQRGIAPHLWFLPTAMLCALTLPALDALEKKPAWLRVAFCALLAVLALLPWRATALFCLEDLRRYLFWYALGLIWARAKGRVAPLSGAVGWATAGLGLAGFIALVPVREAALSPFFLSLTGTLPLVILSGMAGEEPGGLTRFFEGKTFTVYILSLSAQNLMEVLGYANHWPWAVTMAAMLAIGLTAPLAIHRLVRAIAPGNRFTAFLRRMLGMDG